MILVPLSSHTIPGRLLLSLPSPSTPRALGHLVSALHATIMMLFIEFSIMFVFTLLLFRCFFALCIEAPCVIPSGFYLIAFWR